MADLMKEVDENKILVFNGQNIMIDVFDDFFMIRKENNSDEYLIQAQYTGNNDHSCDSSHGLISWKFIGIQNEIEAVFQCSKCEQTFTVVYDYHDTETYEEIGIESPFTKKKCA